MYSHFNPKIMKRLLDDCIAIAKSTYNYFTKPKILFLDVLRDHLNKYAAENSLKDKTIEKHDYQLNNIKRFLDAQRYTNISIDEIKTKHIEQLRLWLHENIKQGNGQPISIDHSSRHLRMCREACNYAVTEEYIEANKLHGIKTRRSPDKEIISLTVYEVTKFEKFESNRPLWNIVRDLFLFQCFTGISYMDLWLYNISFEQEIFWVSCEKGRGKTRKLYWAEYLKKAQDLHNKYDGKFPHITCQSYNKILKKIAKQLNITKSLTTHIGRKTFATLKRHEGYSIPAISGMLGSTEEVVRKHYVSQGKELIITERARINASKIKQHKAA